MSRVCCHVPQKKVGDCPPSCCSVWPLIITALLRSQVEILLEIHLSRGYSPMPQIPVAGVVQIRSEENLHKNIALAESLLHQAADKGAQTVLLPEAYPLLSLNKAEKIAARELIDGNGPIMSSLKRIAINRNIQILAGGIPESVSEEKGANTFVVVAPDGQITAKYRKIHLFDVDIPGKVKLCESAETVGGQELVTCESPVGTLGLSICYDLRFPELYRGLVEAGAQILCVPAAFTRPTGHAHWHELLRARAIENQCWVLAAGQWGRHHAKRTSYGHSMIINPWGEIVGELPIGNGVLVATIDLGKLQTIRQNLPCLRHRRF